MSIRSGFIYLILCLAYTLVGQETPLKSTAMESWQYPYPINHLSVLDSVDIAYVDEGTGPVLLFVHGLGSNLQAWKKNIDSLSENHRCIALDLPGYGKSGPGKQPYTMHFFAETVNALITQLELTDVTLVGHSMGGQVAVHTVLLHTENIKSLVLVAPAGFETFTPPQQQWFATYLTPAVVEATPEAQIIKNFELNFYAMPEDARFMITDRMELRDSPAYADYCQMIPQCVNAMLQEPVFDRLADIQLPALVVFGENDALIPNKFLNPELSVMAVAKAGVEELPQGELTILGPAGHFVQWEKAAALNELIRNFIRN
jgi:pimeloyl-ACP methyl ester carboxylesterase